MTCAIYTTAELDALIAETKAAVLAYNAGILALSSGTKMYQLDTGQTRQMVTRANLSDMRRTLDYLEERLGKLVAQRNNCRGGSFTARPGW